MVPISPIIFENRQVRNFLVRYQHLSDDSALQSVDEIVDFVRKVGCIQYEPLDEVGRNPDLVLQSRCGFYRKGDIDKLLYSDRVLFDVWDKCMSISTVGDWSSFERFRRRHLAWCGSQQAAIDEITQYLRAHESACSSDFAMEDKVAWHYGPQRLAKAALEAMCYAGLAVVHHKKGTRRYYALADKHIPEKEYKKPSPYQTDEDYFKWVVLRRINSIGLLWNKPSDAWLGLGGLKSAERNQAFRSLLDEGKITEIAVEGIKQPLYMTPRNVELLHACGGNDAVSDQARILAPLDNMLWDRKLIAELFGFVYKWEVYTPAADRTYGYYVLPVLCDNKLVARIEMETDKKTKTLIVKNLWAEDGIVLPEYSDKILAGLATFQAYNLCERTEVRCSLSGG